MASVPTLSASSSLNFNDLNSWVTQLKQLNPTTWVALADGHLKLLDVPSCTLAPVALSFEPNTFVQPWGPHELLIASGQNLVMCDVRQPQPAFTLKGQGKPYASLAVQPHTGTAAVGTELAQHEALIELWDMRSRNMGHVYREVHSDDITTLAFHNAPGRQRILLSGSTDGLFSATDTSIADEDDAVLGVGQVGATVKSAAWTSPTDPQSNVFALTDMQTLSLWTSHEPEQLQDYGDLRESASLAMPSGFKCDYVVDFDGHSKLMLGSNTNGFVEVNVSNPKHLQVSKWYQGTHTPDEVIRCAATSADGRYTLSGGEDGKIVVWTHASGTELMDVDLAQAEQQGGKKKKSKKHRYNPY